MKEIKSSAILSTAFLLFLASASLFPQEETAETVLEKCQESVIVLSVLDNNKEEIKKGTGFVIEDGIVATAYHLISQAANVEGKNYKGKRIRFEGVLAAAKEYDVAFLQMKGKAGALALGNSDGLAQGKTVYVVGSNAAGELRVDDGTIRKILKLSAVDWLADTTFVSSDTFCGGPVCDENGQVLGLIVFLDDRTRVIVPINSVKNLSRTGTPVPFAGEAGDDYFETYEGANLAGRSFHELENSGKAERYFSKVINVKPDDMDILILLASVYTDQRNYSSAVSIYKRIIELNAGSETAHYGLGIVHLRMMNWKEAVSSLQKTVELNPANKEAFLLLGNAQYELREFDEAAESYNKYISMNPENLTEAYQQLGMSYFEAEKFDQAIPAFQEALKSNSQDINLNYKLAQAFQKSGQYEKAEEIYSLLAQLSPEDTRIYYNTIVMMYDEAQLPEKAVEAARKLVEIEPDNSDALFNLGYMLIKQEKFEDSIEIFNKVIEISPGMEYAYLQLGYSHTQLKQYSKAVEVYQKLVGIMPENADAWLGIAIGNMQQKKWDPAVEPLKKVIDLRPDSGNAYYNLAICYLNLKDNYSARQVYQQLRKIDPNLAAKLAGFLK